MIDPSIEELVPVMESRALFPPSRRRSKDDPSGERSQIGVAKLLRLCTQGNSKGVRLESLTVSGVRYTSKQAIARFLKAASAAEEEGGADETVKQRARRAAKAKKAATAALYPEPRRQPGCKAAAARPEVDPSDETLAKAGHRKAAIGAT